MSNKEGRLPGELLRKLLERLFARRVFEDLVIPTLADLQYESAHVRQASVWRRAFVLTRAYFGVWRALTVCLATWPARSLRRDWLEADAAGPRLLRTLIPRACVLGLGFTLLVEAQGTYRHALVTRDPWLPLLSLPSVLAVVVPVAFFFGLVLALGRLGAEPSTSAGARPLGAVVGLSMATGLLTFGMCGWVTPEANHSFRERVFHRLSGQAGNSGAPLLKGARELTLGELHALIHARQREGASTVAFDVEWHKKWAIPATCLVFGPLAIGLSGLSSRPRLLVTLALAWAANCLAWGALRFGEQAALSGRMGPLPAIWAGNALLAVVTCWLIGRQRSLGAGVTAAA